MKWRLILDYIQIIINKFLLNGSIVSLHIGIYLGTTRIIEIMLITFPEAPKASFVAFSPYAS
ncbi:MAG: hypothetical protein ACUVWQ_06680 [Candidatus Aminicenantales bacterium]